MEKREKIDAIIFILTLVLIVGVFILSGYWHLGKWGFKGYHYYTVDTDMEDCGKISTYHGESDYPRYYSSSGSKECYSINNNKVTISVGDLSCGNSIKITELKVDKKMNVYIKAKGIQTELTLQCGYCNPKATIYFLRKVKSVTLVNEDGKKLGKC